MKNYIDKWVSLISNCRTDNTYKMAWGKALVEYSMIYEGTEEEVVISFDKLAPFVLKYYWNQTIYFDLLQGQNPQKEPVVKQETEKLIAKYFEKIDNKLPKRFEGIKFEKLGLEGEYKKTLKKISKTLGENVSYRFLNVNNDIYDVYYTEKKMKHLVISNKNLVILKEYNDILFQLINFKWTQILEKYNTSPKIAKKVKGTHEINGVKRSSLKKFHKILELENPSKTCFYTGEGLEEGKLSVDHIIPWSFMFSDDIWNLVFCSKSKNSSKSNHIVNEKIIERVEARNIRLLKQIKNIGIDKVVKEYGIKKKEIEVLEGAIEKDLLRKFWIASKG